MARRHECANCGRDVRGLPDSERRFEDGHWYCSQSCFLTAESAASRSHIRKPSKPRRRGRRRLGWTIGVLVAFLVVTGVLGALVGTTPDKGTSKTASGSGSGSRSDPVSLGQAATIGGGWWVKVNSVRWNARALFTTKPPAGARDVLLSLTLSYRGGGKDDSGNLANWILQTEGAHNASYTASDDSCGTPRNGNRKLDGPLAIGAWPTLFSGRSVTGPLCFQVAANDVNSLLLYSTGKGDQYGLLSFPGVKTVWFALR